MGADIGTHDSEMMIETVLSMLEKHNNEKEKDQSKKKKKKVRLSTFIDKNYREETNITETITQRVSNTYLFCDPYT